MKFLLIPVGYYMGSLVLGGLFYSISGSNSGKSSAVEKETYTWIGRIVGIIIATAIVVSI
jgi:hypothetical protein